MKKILCFLVAALAWPTFASQTYRGTFIHYEGAEYESTFVPCGSGEVLSVVNGPEQKKLVKRAKANPKLEVPVSLELDITPINKTQYPQSHYTGTARVIRIITVKGGDKPCEAIK